MPLLRNALAAALLGLALPATALAQTAAAQTAGPQTAAAGATAAPAGTVQQLQWGAIDVTAAQFKPMRDLAVNALGMHPVNDQPNFAVLVAPNGSLFEIYGPGSPRYPWRGKGQGMAFGFMTDDIATSLKAITKAGGVLLGPLRVFPHAGADGGDYAFQLFRAADHRVYAIAQGRNYHPK